MRASLVLLGYKGSGKTYFGKLLSRETEMAFIDTDHLIEEQYVKMHNDSLCCRDIHFKLGETAFRMLEKKMVFGLKPEEMILSTGGGVVLDLESRKKLSSLGKLVYLKVDKKILEQRIFQREIPSFLDPKEPKIAFEKMYEERNSIYEKID